MIPNPYIEPTNNDCCNKSQCESSLVGGQPRVGAGNKNSIIADPLQDFLLALMTTEDYIIIIYYFKGAQTIRDTRSRKIS